MDESWIIKKAEHWRMDAFQLWCWRRLLRVPWTARRSNLSILKEISPEYSLEGLMLKLKLPIRWPSDGKNWLIGKDPDAGRDWRQEKRVTRDKTVGWHHQLNSQEFEQTLRGGEGQRSLVCCSPWGHRVRHDWVTEHQQQHGYRCTIHIRQTTFLSERVAHLVGEILRTIMLKI